MAPSAMKTAVYSITIAFLASAGYDRGIAYSTVISNLPWFFKPINTFGNYDIKFRDVPGVRNCEDVVLNEARGVAILTCDPGRDGWNTVMGVSRNDKDFGRGGLWMYDYSHSDRETDDSIARLEIGNFANVREFRPLGLELDRESSTLYVVNHARSGPSLEVFHVEYAAKSLTHIRTVTHPLLHAPNAIESVGNGKLYVTNDHMFSARFYPLLSKIETYTGFAGGTVVYIDTNHPETTTKVVARVPFANGIVRFNATTLAVASSSDIGVRIFDVKPNFDLEFSTRFRTPSAVDNLSIDSEGILLMAGHPDPFALAKVSKNRPDCDPGSDSAVARKACSYRSPSWAGQWSGAEGVKTLFKSLDFCTSSTMVRDHKRGVTIISGLYERGLMVVRD